MMIGFSYWLELKDIRGMGWGVVFACVAIQTVGVELLKMWARYSYSKGYLQEIRWPWSRKRTTRIIRPF